MKGENYFGYRMLFQLVPGDFSYRINQNNYNSNWKKVLGFRNMQEKLENILYSRFVPRPAGKEVDVPKLKKS